ncbi:hemerythrin family protein [Deferribacter thermophilus]|uniref:bacteriohemerythrin n=1 Tax=Deferribacter thermophilus TaxID=53573 RepID=UPI003C1FCC05
MKEYLPENLITGIDRIDEQHGAMFYLLAKIEKYFKVGEGEKAISDSLTFLENYVKTHFKTEEEFMQKYNYPDYEVHKLEHESLEKILLKKD